MGIRFKLKKVFFNMQRRIISMNCKLAKACGYNKLLDDYMVSMMKCYEDNSDCYASYRLRAKTVNSMALIEEPNEIDAQVGIG